MSRIARFTAFIRPLQPASCRVLRGFRVSADSFFRGCLGFRGIGFRVFGLGGADPKP